MFYQMFSPFLKLQEGRGSKRYHSYEDRDPDPHDPCDCPEKHENNKH